MNITFRTQHSRRAAVSVAAAALIALSLTGCASGDANSNGSEHGQHSEVSSGVTATDTWAKATAADAAPGTAMSGLFGTIENHGETDLTITSLESDAAGVVELHEVVDGKMRKIAGDVTVKAGGKLTLEPGANHIMLMEIHDALLPGDDVTVTVTFSDGSKLDVVALVKDTSGANESYDDMEHGESGDHDAMSHGDSTDHDAMSHG